MLLVSHLTWFWTTASTEAEQNECIYNTHISLTCHHLGEVMSHICFAFMDHIKSKALVPLCILFTATVARYKVRVCSQLDQMPHSLPNHNCPFSSVLCSALTLLLVKPGQTKPQLLLCKCCMWKCICVSYLVKLLIILRNHQHDQTVFKQMNIINHNNNKI